MIPNETPEQRRERQLSGNSGILSVDERREKMMSMIEKQYGSFAFKLMGDFKKNNMVDCMIAVEDACRATMFTEEQVREAIIYAIQLGLSPDASTDEIPFNEIIDEIKQKP